MSTKPLRKTAIAIPAQLLDAVDVAAKANGESRSRYVARVLELAVRARRNAEITRRLDELFSDPKIAGAQHETAQAFDQAGSSWDDERW